MSDAKNIPDQPEEVAVGRASTLEIEARRGDESWVSVEVTSLPASAEPPMTALERASVYAVNGAILLGLAFLMVSCP